MPSAHHDPSLWMGVRVPPDDHAVVHVNVSQGYTGIDIRIPLFVWRGAKPGPAVFVSAAVHGDEINGTGAIRHIIAQQPFALTAGTLVLAPVVNILGFERHSRYLPDRRDLNRSFPGSGGGSLASRLARSFFQQVITRCDYGIDLHTAAVRRTNFPNVRADMTTPEIATLARAFGTALIVSGRGPKGSLRRAACAAGCPTIILEAGEVWKVEPTVVEVAVRGIANCLAHLRMIDAVPSEPPYRLETDATSWVRAERGGFLAFHVAPGAVVSAGDAIATSSNLTGEDEELIAAPRDGVVLGMTTLPTVAPGDPVCHLAYAKHAELRGVERAVDALDGDHLYERVREDLARSVMVTNADDEPAPPPQA